MTSSKHFKERRWRGSDPADWPLREQNLADDQEIDLLKRIVQQEKSRQGISDPMDG